MVEKIIRCRECKNWIKSGSVGGSAGWPLEMLGSCIWVKGCTKESDYCSKAKLVDEVPEE